MAERFKILFISAEVSPYAKTGGLGDVGGSLPKALRALGHDVRVVMPAYRRIEADYAAGRGGLWARPGGLHVTVRGAGVPAGLLEGRLPGTDVPIYFIAHRGLFDRDTIYGYGDDPYRFAFFSRAALELTVAANWRPDLVHAHDWHAAPAVAWLATAGQAADSFRGIPSLFTIHNLAHQGDSPWDIMNYLGLVTHGLLEEAYGRVNFMARGIYHATLVNTVSPSYAREILTHDGGVGLDGLLRYRGHDVHGILNGLDYDVWNPAADAGLAATYTADQLERRRLNKLELQRRAGLPERADVPLVGMVTRLDWQKGVEVTLPVIRRLMQRQAGEAQFIVVGTGAPHYEAALAQLAAAYPQQMAVALRYAPELAPLVYGGSDIFVMPSLFEPCGLGQLIAMHYGCVPVVRATGGLADTVQEGLTGFTFIDYDPGAFWDALARAIYVYNVDRESWRAIQRAGMTVDLSWQRSARGYQQLYEWMVARGV
jgi:starch synthase